MAKDLTETLTKGQLDRLEAKAAEGAQAHQVTAAPPAAPAGARPLPGGVVAVASDLVDDHEFTVQWWPAGVGVVLATAGARTVLSLAAARRLARALDAAADLGRMPAAKRSPG